MRRAVVAAESGAIHAERDVEILQRHVVNDHVVGALHEGRVNRQERLELQSAELRRANELQDKLLKIISRLHSSRSALNPVLDADEISRIVVAEAAEALKVSVGTVRRDWSLAQAWLFRELSRGRQ